METSTRAISEQLRRYLKYYEMTAMNSLGGPSNEKINELFSTSLMSAAAAAAANTVADEKIETATGGCGSHLSDDFTIGQQQQQLAHPLPVMTPRDQSCDQCMDTIIKGEVVSCFLVGGEKRLCFPQVLNTILQEYELHEINKACSDLNIHCSHCTKHQLEVLKLAGILPLSMATCSLITNTDAERLCNFLAQKRREEYRQGHNNNKNNTLLLTKNSSSSNNVGDNKQSYYNKHSILSSSSSSSIFVCHACFGRCKGRYYPDKFISLTSKCVQCDECNEFLSPDKFVVHSHRVRETRTCHWGFDSNKWRSYVNLLPEYENIREYEEILDDMKSRFTFDTTTLKRSAAEVATINQEKQHNEKKARMEPVKVISQSPPDPTTTTLLLDNNNVINNNFIGTNVVPPATANLIQLLCDPFLAPLYYHLLTTARFNNSVAAATVLPYIPLSAAQPPPLISTGVNSVAAAVAAAPPPQVPFSVEEAAVALLKLAPHSCVVDKTPSMHQLDDVSNKSKATDKCNSQNLPSDPLKKHQFTYDQGQKQQCKAVHGSSSDLCATENDDFANLQILLERYIKDEEGLRRIGDKLRHARRAHEEKMESLMAQNRILHEEINYLRNRQNLTTTSSIVIP